MPRVSDTVGDGRQQQKASVDQISSLSPAESAHWMQVRREFFLKSRISSAQFGRQASERHSRTEVRDDVLIRTQNVRAADISETKLCHVGLLIGENAGKIGSSWL